VLSACANELQTEAVEIDGEACLAISVLVADHGCIRFNHIEECSQVGCLEHVSV
jgi:hypothetical protein